MTRETDLAKILGDLDRCQHGRHRGDPVRQVSPYVSELFQQWMATDPVARRGYATDPLHRALIDQARMLLAEIDASMRQSRIPESTIAAVITPVFGAIAESFGQVGADRHELMRPKGAPQ